jgi:hypothetical protein
MPQPQISDQQRKANVRLGLMLGAAAVVFGVGFVAKVVFFGW